MLSPHTCVGAVGDSKASPHCSAAWGLVSSCQQSQQGLNVRCTTIPQMDEDLLSTLLMELEKSSGAAGLVGRELAVGLQLSSKEKKLALRIGLG